MASRHELRARHTEEKQKQNPQQRFKRNMAVAALVGMAAAAAIGVLAKEYFLDYGDITVKATEDGNFVSYTDENEEYHEREENNDGEIIITQDSEDAVKNTLTIDAEEDQTVEVTIRDVNIDVSGNAIYNDKYQIQNGEDLEAAISIEGAGNVILELDGKNVVKSDEWHAGVETAGTGMLTIEDKDHDGSLDATGGEEGAGIGGGLYGDGNVMINGGEITATGGNFGAGIGGGGNGSTEVTINGGTVIAKGGDGAAGIGSGTSNELESAKITINGGEVTATGGRSGAGIGTGMRGDGKVKITGGTVEARGGLNGAGIGSGPKANSAVTITGGTVSATSGRWYYSIYNDNEPDAIGRGGYQSGQNEPQSTVVYDEGTIIEQRYGWDADGHTHAWEVSEYTAPTYEAKGVEISLCECGSKKTEFLPALTSNGQMPLTVTTLLSTAQPYEQTMENGRAVFAAPAQDAILTGSLGALAELKAQGATTLVFRTQLCETSVSIDKILSAGSEEDVFVLTHKGTQAVLTVEGRVVE